GLPPTARSWRCICGGWWTGRSEGRLSGFEKAGRLSHLSVVPFVLFYMPRLCGDGLDGQGYIQSLVA
ncbi:MAG TPA: hypothetical protein P5329_05430, partial [Candidatus Competibacteraceae bacterium]|nr:hypothetical protein [Candidatus Competibacteraceae bacterium]